jgi:hypothetical protein
MAEGSGQPGCCGAGKVQGRVQMYLSSLVSPMASAGAESRLF